MTFKQNETHPLCRGILLSLLLLSLFVSGCRKDLPVLDIEEEKVIVTPGDDTSPILGFYLLNEGNMGSNKASIDYFDLTTGIYKRNIYPSQNPNIVKELGDVGNDIAIYGSKLYAVINASNYIEVMDARTAKHLGSINVDNCRNITFYEGKAYVTSYAGPIQLDPNARPGKVVEIDTLTLQTTREVVVGYQPDGIVATEGKLYVANSGGYRMPNYDTTVSVVNIADFRVESTIEVAKNLGQIVLDSRGMLYVISRGDYGDTPADIYTIDTKTNTVVSSLGISPLSMHLSGDSLYIIEGTMGATASGNSEEYGYLIYDTSKKEIVNRGFITDGTQSQIKMPYGLTVHPSTRAIFIADATDYVTPGQLFIYSKDGVLKSKVTTGDIPAHFAWSRVQTDIIYQEEEPDAPNYNGTAFVTKVLDYRPAVGQFTNGLPAYKAGDTQESMNEKVLLAIGNNKRGLVSLGGYGGYVVVGFDHTIENKSGLRDFRVAGNGFAGNSEPGIVMVAYDKNKNGLPDEEEWYEIAGSAHKDPTQEEWYEKAKVAGNDVRFIRDYEITYYRPTTEPEGATDNYIKWKDNQGGEGYLPKNIYHKQPYFPQWIDSESITFKGSRLPQNSINEAEEGATDDYFVLHDFKFGYADNSPLSADNATFDIDWAVDKEGKPVKLLGVDFIKVYTGVFQVSGWIGECSTEVTNIYDLHLKGEIIKSE